MVAAPVQCDVDGVPNGSHSARVQLMLRRHSGTLAPVRVGVMHRVGARPRPSPRCAHGRTRAPRRRYENRTSSTHGSTRHCRSQRERRAAGCLQLQNSCRARVDAVAPIFTADPIRDLAVPLQVEARNVTHDPTVDLDDSVRRRAVAPQPRPPLLEGGSIIGIRRSERGHPYSVAIPRVLEQHAEITIFDLAKDKLSRALPHGR